MWLSIFPVILNSTLAFLLIILVLTILLVYAKTKLVPSGDVKIIINGQEDKPLITKPGG